MTPAQLSVSTNQQCTAIDWRENTTNYVTKQLQFSQYGITLPDTVGKIQNNEITQHEALQTVVGDVWTVDQVEMAQTGTVSTNCFQRLVSDFMIT